MQINQTETVRENITGEGQGEERIPDTREGMPDKLGGKELEERLPAACYS